MTLPPLNSLKIPVNDDEQWRAVFPEEIWLMILSYVTSPHDMYNCAMAAPFLQRLLEPKKSFYLFAQVLQALDQYNTLQPCRYADLIRVFGPVDGTGVPKDYPVSASRLAIMNARSNASPILPGDDAPLFAR